MHSELVDQKYLHTHTHTCTQVLLYAQSAWRNGMLIYHLSFNQSPIYLPTYYLSTIDVSIWPWHVQLYVHYLTCMKSSV